MSSDIAIGIRRGDDQIVVLLVNPTEVEFIGHGTVFAWSRGWEFSTKTELLILKHQE